MNNCKTKQTFPVYNLVTWQVSSITKACQKILITTEVIFNILSLKYIELLIINDECENIDSNHTDITVGGRKRR